MQKDNFKTLTVKQFIQTVLITDVGRMVNRDCKLYYLSFGVIAQGVEFLGACLDEMPWDEDRQSESRFNKAVRQLFPKPYAKHLSKSSEYYLYESLRCGLVHMLRPQRKVFLTHTEESRREKTTHLGKTEDKLILIAEDLYEDFRKACEKIIWRIDHNRIAHKKVNGPYLIITDWAK